MRRLSRTAKLSISGRRARKLDSWDGLFELCGKGDVPGDFMGPADRKQPPQDRDPFKGWRFKGRKE